MAGTVLDELVDPKDQDDDDGVREDWRGNRLVCRGMTLGCRGVRLGCIGVRALKLFSVDFEPAAWPLGLVLNAAKLLG